jgi:anion-transporting  ArsA/GET3 family ATPase
MLLDSLLERRLVVLTGKGGVGKSTFGMALGLAATRRGKRVLLLEIDAPRDAASRLGSGPSGGREVEILPGLFAANLLPPRVLDEYVRKTVKLEMLSRRILESPIYTRFVAAAPGLKELVTLGKVMVLEEAKEGFSKRRRYDLVILDAPATGHGLSLLSVPLAARDAVPVGPVGANARRIVELLQDPRRTGIVLVAIPEEMAVVEAVELHQSLEAGGFPVCSVLLNACHERRFTDHEEAEILRTNPHSPGRLDGTLSLEGALLAARRHILKRRLMRVHEARLKRIGLPLLKLPFLAQDLDREALLRLASRLEAA